MFVLSGLQSANLQYNKKKLPYCSPPPLTAVRLLCLSLSWHMEGWQSVLDLLAGWMDQLIVGGLHRYRSPAPLVSFFVPCEVLLETYLLGHMCQCVNVKGFTSLE